ncbi:MAG: SusC/RagA family TonB-linked outer membrane protein [Saprospiraceae bacterium]|nr:SusC/RagA family TonB-linked outer membrane protein [Saprospiraceae bacterium]
MKIRNELRPLLLVVLLAFTYGSRASTASFLEDEPLSAVLDRISENYEVIITYESSLLSKIKVEFELREGESLEFAVNRAISKTDLRYKQLTSKYYIVYKGNRTNKKSLRKIKKKFEQIEKLQLEENISIQQTSEQPLEVLNTIFKAAREELAERTISGTVTDETGAPLVGATVLVQNTAIGTTTDLNGKFALDVPDDANVLEVSYTGYASQEVLLDGKSTFDIQLAESISELDEVVVVGYGTVRKRDLTGSVGSLDAREFEDEVISNVSQGLQGKVAGVNVTTNGGAPGGAMIVRIRGNNSVIGGNDPLYVVDGFPITAGNIGETNLLATLNPGDIESIEVLKDASATAIYGSRGSNGVVLITTKQGKQGLNRVEFETSVGTRNVARTLDMMNSSQFLELANERAVNDGNAPFFTPEEVATFSRTNTDWQDEVFRSALVHNHSLRFSGGNDNTRYLVSGNYFSEEGIIIGSNFNRGSVRLNLDKDFGDRFKLSTRMSLSRSSNNEVPANNIMLSALSAPPFLTPRYEDGSYVPGPELKRFPFSPSAGSNPVAVALEQLDHRIIDRVLANMSGSYEILDGLTFKVLAGIDQLNNNLDFYNPRTLEAGLPAGSGSKSFGSTTSFLNENTLNYNTNLRSNDRLDVTLGFTWQEEVSEFLSGSASGFVTDDLQNDGLSAGENFGAPNTDLTEWSLLSFLGRVNYNLDEKYLFTFSGRRDGSSRFGEGNKWGFFPSVAFAWRLLEEDFIQSALPSNVSDLKFRMSWGISGNQAISPFQSLQRFSDVSLAFGGTPTTGFRPANLGNPDLKWETTNEFNVGLEFGLWNQRLSLSADYYVKNTEDLLALVNLPPTSGFSTTIQNIGSTRNNGVELNLGAVIMRKSNMQWDANFNIAANRNEVTETATGQDIVGPGIEIVGPANVVREGEPLSAFFGLELDGLTEEGLFNYVDQNGDGNINDADRVILGSPYPDLFYGFSSDFSVGNFSLRVNFQGELGKELWFMDIYRFGASMHRGGNSFSDVATDRWRPDNPDPNAKYPRATQTLNQQPSEFYLEKADYLRLQNLRLSYNLPLKSWNFTGIKSASIYFSGQNLFTITPYSGYTPDIDTFSSGDLRIGIDYRSYPISRSFLFGLKVGL